MIVIFVLLLICIKLKYYYRKIGLSNINRNFDWKKWKAECFLCKTSRENFEKQLDFYFFQSEFQLNLKGRIFCNFKILRNWSN